MKKCKSCKIELPYTKRNGIKTYKHKYGFGIDCGCLSKYYLNTEEGKERLQKATLKATKTRRELEQAKKDHRNRKGLTTLLQGVKIACHTYIRERDKGKPCISCGTPYKSDFDAGHYYSGGKFSQLKFNEDNIHGQCIRCNRMNEGNFDEYTVNLPGRIGKERFEELNRLAEQSKREVFKWDREELKKIRDYYKRKLKELKNNS